MEIPVGIIAVLGYVIFFGLVFGMGWVWFRNLDKINPMAHGVSVFGREWFQRGVDRLMEKRRKRAEAERVRREEEIKAFEARQRELDELNKKFVNGLKEHEVFLKNKGYATGRKDLPKFNNNLLREAIEDAKAVRRTALARANEGEYASLYGGEPRETEIPPMAPSVEVEGDYQVGISTSVPMELSGNLLSSPLPAVVRDKATGEVIMESGSITKEEYDRIMAQAKKFEDNALREYLAKKDAVKVSGRNMGSIPSKIYIG